MSVRIAALAERDPGVVTIFFANGRTVTLDTRVALATLTAVLGSGARWLGRRVEYQILAPAPGGVYTRLAMVAAAAEPLHHPVQGN